MKPDFHLSMPGIMHRIARRATVLMLPVAFSACTWFTDFKTQPSIKPWEPMSQNPADTLVAPRGQPLHSVPVQGTSAVAYAISYAPLPPVIDSFNVISNPVAADARSLDNGRKNYQINCAVCHGAIGDGNGGLVRVNPAYRFAPSLLAESAVGRADGYVYGIIRNGRGIMPSYARIEEADRWDVVNYVRTLQKGAADTTHGYPGENGTTVPGPSLTAPTVPSRYVHPTVQLTPGSSGINSATFRSKNEGDGIRALHGAPHAETQPAGATTSKATPAGSKEKHP